MNIIRFITSLGLTLCLFHAAHGQSEAEAPSVTLQHLNGHSTLKIIEGRSRIIYRTEDGQKRKGHVSYVGNTEMVVGGDTVQFSDLRMLQGMKSSGRGMDFRGGRPIFIMAIIITLVTGLLFLVWRSAVVGYWFEGGLMLLGLTTFSFLFFWAVMMVILPIFLWLALRKYHIHTKWNFDSPKMQTETPKG